MAKKLKEGTLEKIRHIIEEEGGTEKLTKKQLKKHKSFINMQKGYMNAYERGIADSIINMIYDGKTNDEIQLVLGEVSETKEEVVTKAEKESEEIEAETEAMFVNSTGQVVDGPIIVTAVTDDNKKSTNSVDENEPAMYVNSTGKVVSNDKDDKVEYHPVTGTPIVSKPTPSTIFASIIRIMNDKFDNAFAEAETATEKKAV